MATLPRNRIERALREHALSYPEATEDFPWPDHRAIKVRGKMFVILSHDADGLSLSVKLPWSAEGALQLFPFCAPTGYGMGRSGWVTATLGPKARAPLGVLRSFVDESYRAVAPRKVVALIARRGASPLVGTATPGRAPRRRPGGTPTAWQPERRAPRPKRRPAARRRA